MPLIIAAYGAPLEVLVNGQRRPIKPFMGADREGEFAQMGIGVIFRDAAYEGKDVQFWGQVIPHKLIQSWRGMKILERITQFEARTLCACWMVAQHTVPETYRYLLEQLSEQVGGLEALQTLRDTVLASAPATDELNMMIAHLRDHGVEVDALELEEEMTTGQIEATPLIETLVREEYARRAAYPRHEAEAPPKAPLTVLENIIQFVESRRRRRSTRP